MNIYKLFDNMTKYISEAVVRIFGPNDDAYPNTGVQPFTDDPYKPRRADW